jgi:plasmid stabilization system protein ParE
MRYALVYLDAAEDDLAAAYLAGRERRRAADVTAAAARVEELLRTDPAGCGESRDRHQRFMVEPPLGVLFELHEAERVVIILSVRYSSRWR